MMDHEPVEDRMQSDNARVTNTSQDTPTELEQRPDLMKNLWVRPFDASVLIYDEDDETGYFQAFGVDSTRRQLVFWVRGKSDLLDGFVAQMLEDLPGAEVKNAPNGCATGKAPRLAIVRRVRVGGIVNIFIPPSGPPRGVTADGIFATADAFVQQDQ